MLASHWLVNVGLSSPLWFYDIVSNLNAVFLLKYWIMVYALHVVFFPWGWHCNLDGSRCGQLPLSSMVLPQVWACGWPNLPKCIQPAPHTRDSMVRVPICHRESRRWVDPLPLPLLLASLIDVPVHHNATCDVIRQGKRCSPWGLRGHLGLGPDPQLEPIRDNQENIYCLGCL